MKKMKITIHKDGTQKVEVLGAVGEECVELTRELEERLGPRELKPEYHESESETEQDYEVDR